MGCLRVKFFSQLAMQRLFGCKLQEKLPRVTGPHVKVLLFFVIHLLDSSEPNMERYLNRDFVWTVDPSVCPYLCTDEISDDLKNAYLIKMQIHRTDHPSQV